MTIDLVQLEWTADANIIVGQSHFIKTVEDIAEIMANSLPGARYGLAFNEASGPCLVRSCGSDPKLQAEAEACALASGAGHSFYLILGEGAFPINILDRLKACPEVCRIYCATANPVQLILARSEQGAGILGVIDGSSPKGVETDTDKAARLAFLRKIGYKFG